MYLRGSKWNMRRKRRKRSSPGRIIVLLLLIAAVVYVNQVIVPVTPPLFIPTPTMLTLAICSSVRPYLLTVLEVPRDSRSELEQALT